MWFVFPQIRGLGSSPMAQRFAISGPGEAHSLPHSPRPRRTASRLHRFGQRCERPLCSRHLRLSRRSQVSLLGHTLRVGSRARASISKIGKPCLCRCLGQILQRKTRSGHDRPTAAAWGELAAALLALQLRLKCLLPFGHGFPDNPPGQSTPSRRLRPALAAVFRAFQSKRHAPRGKRRKAGPSG